MGNIVVLIWAGVTMSFWSVGMASMAIAGLLLFWRSLGFLFGGAWVFSACEFGKRANFWFVPDLEKCELNSPLLGLNTIFSHLMTKMDASLGFFLLGLIVFGLGTAVYFLIAVLPLPNNSKR